MPESQGSRFVKFASGIFVLHVLRSRLALNRTLNGNMKVLSRSQQSDVRKLFHCASTRAFLRKWPPPGVKDETKRSLVAALARGDTSTAGKLTRDLIPPPVCPEKEHLFVDEPAPRADPFYYLRDDDRKNPEVLSYLKEENAYTESVMADTKDIQEKLYKEFRGRIQEADVSAGLYLGGYKYYSRTEEGEQYAVHCRRKIVNEKEMEEEILLDENAESKSHEFYMVGGFDVSPNHSLVAFGVDTTGNEKFTLFVRDLKTGKNVLKKPIPDTDGSFAWSTDNKTVFYTTKDELDRPYKVWKHTIGETSSDLVYHEEDDAFYLGIGLSRSEKYVYIHAGSAITSDVRYIDASKPNEDFKPVLPRAQDVEYSVDDRGDQFIITRRDADKFNSEILVADTADPTSTCAVLIPHSPKIKIENVEVSAEHLAVFQRSDGLQQAVVYELGNGRVNAGPFKSKSGKAISFDEPTYELHTGAQGEFDSTFLRYIYTSFTTPTTVVDYNMKTGEKITRKVSPVLGTFEQNKEKYVSERIMATAPDGVKVPISLVYRRDLVKLDGSDPMLLDAYGSYEICNDADFRSTRLSLLDRGWIFGIAHLRGGGEMGREWYLDGKFLKKKNTFSDFLACTETVTKLKYTSPSRLCISGRSAGGLTMGASINESMKLKTDDEYPHFACAIAGVPFVDCLTTMLDETIPLTTIEFEEWGNPKDSTYYEYMREYSPMDNIQDGKVYPSILVTGGLHDPRVGYWEPAKYVANLRKRTQKGQNIILLKMDMGAGHFSKSGRFDKLSEMAIEYAFLLKCMGMLHVDVQ
jgi:oligopeptidase B